MDTSRIYAFIAAFLVSAGTLLQMLRALGAYRDEHGDDVGLYARYRQRVEAVPAWRWARRSRVRRIHLGELSAEERGAVRRVGYDLVGWALLFAGSVMGMIAAVTA